MDLYKDLPFRSSIRKHRDWYDYKDHKIGDYNIWTIIRKLIERNVGKSFDLTFHYFCKIAPKQYQNDFLEDFIAPYPQSWMTYYVDDQGLIQRFKPKNQYKGPYKIYSDDYKVGYRRIKKRYDRHWIVGKSYIEKESLTWYDNPKDFEKVIQGQIWEFESRKDPTYVAYKRRQFKKKKQEYKKYKKRQKGLSEKIFNTAIESCSAEARRQREIDQVKLIKHGFDNESFKGSNYHGRKNKKDKFPTMDK